MWSFIPHHIITLFFTNNWRYFTGFAIKSSFFSSIPSIRYGVVAARFCCFPQLWGLSAKAKVSPIHPLPSAFGSWCRSGGSKRRGNDLLQAVLSMRKLPLPRIESWFSLVCIYCILIYVGLCQWSILVGPGFIHSRVCLITCHRCKCCSAQKEPTSRGEFGRRSYFLMGSDLGMSWRKTCATWAGDEILVPQMGCFKLSTTRGMTCRSQVSSCPRPVARRWFRWLWELAMECMASMGGWKSGWGTSWGLRTTRT